MKKSLVLLWIVSVCCHAQVPYSEIVSQPNISPDAKFSYGSDPLQHVLYWQANTKSADLGGAPIVLFIHGGCWLNAYNIDHSLPFTSSLAENGVDVYSIEYRRTGDIGGGWPGSLRDILAALDVVAKHLDTIPNKPKRVYLMGHSAGGHLALLASQASSLSFTSIIGLAAITDLPKYAEGTNSCQMATPKFMDGLPADKPKAYDEANPANKTFAKPVILLHGSKDDIVPLSHSRLAQAKSVVIDGAGHFDFLHSESASFSILLEHIFQ